MNFHVLSVTQVTTYIKSLLEGDLNLSTVFLSGEISNFTNHYRSGHFYFSLKDDKSVIRAVMFSSYARRLRFSPQDGMKVLVRGHISVYEASGQYQLYVEDMQPDGVGALNVAYEQLKNRLESEGLFNKERKKNIPSYPKRIGVITSPTGAAVRDILQVLARRWPMAQVIFCPVLVQGENAAPQISKAVKKMNDLPKPVRPDVLIVGRGGGSLEDLWAFNEEITARAVANSDIPVISAVGHETDFTICDFAADLRAPTPSAAAELAVPNQSEEFSRVQMLYQRLSQAEFSHIQTLRHQTDFLAQNRAFSQPMENLQILRMNTDKTVNAMLAASQKQFHAAKEELAVAAGKLDALSPLQVLHRGYAAAQNQKGETISSVNDVLLKESVSVLLKDGKLYCTVEGSELYESKNDI